MIRWKRPFLPLPTPITTHNSIQPSSKAVANATSTPLTSSALGLMLAHWKAASPSPLSTKSRAPVISTPTSYHCSPPKMPGLQAHKPVPNATLTTPKIPGMRWTWAATRVSCSAAMYCLIRPVWPLCYPVTGATPSYAHACATTACHPAGNLTLKRPIATARYWNTTAATCTL